MQSVSIYKSHPVIDFLRVQYIQESGEYQDLQDEKTSTDVTAENQKEDGEGTNWW
jgi:hypothetical protein